VIKTPAVGKYCTAYENGKSVRGNAEIHAKAKHILHIDIKDFFPSINKALFMKAYRPLLCRNCRGDKCTACADRLWKIVSLNGGLPIGAPTSPFIANRVMTETDERLAALDKSMTYTRYADDMIFSSDKYIDKSFIARVENIISEAGFKGNPKKTYFMSARKLVTGVLINNGKLSVGTSYKKRLKQDIYNYLVKGEGKPDSLRGRLAWLGHIEPQYAETVKGKYLSIDNKGLFSKEK
jgi:retron-type reverse transcriptase